MDTTITVRVARLTPAEQRRLREVGERLKRYFRSAITLHWDLGVDGPSFVASCRVHSRSGYYRARATADRLGEAIDIAFERVTRQRRRVHKQVKKKRTRAARVLAAAAAEL
jgi:ribosome-associated translation inhibitor RaiA